MLLLVNRSHPATPGDDFDPAVLPGPQQTARVVLLSPTATHTLRINQTRPDSRLIQDGLPLV
jgi:hypothetical protein